MKKSIFDLGNDVTLKKILKLNSFNQLENVCFIEDLNDYESIVIASLCNISKKILLIGFDNLKIPLICLMNSKDNSKIYLVTKCEKILNLFYQYNDQNNQISLRDESNKDNNYYEEINQNDTLKDKFELEEFDKNNIKEYIKRDYDLKIYNLEGINNKEHFLNLICKNYSSKNINFIRSNCNQAFKKNLNKYACKISKTDLYFIKK
tara:strand:+ start:3843 stop:4460 length:618 start_codon:yes stop_codon:yes gene_type:complete